MQFSVITHFRLQPLSRASWLACMKNDRLPQLDIVRYPTPLTSFETLQSLTVDQYQSYEWAEF